MKVESTWWWLSFVGKRGFLGVCIVEATAFDEAILKTWKAECNPGGEVVAIPLDATDANHAAIIAELPKERLLTKQEVAEYGERLWG